MPGPSQRDDTFTAEAVEIMADALDEVCAALDIPETSNFERDVIAARIIDLAQTGVLDMHVLRDRVLLELRPRSASSISG